LLATFAIALATLLQLAPGATQLTCLIGFAALTTLGLILLPIQLLQSVREVNRSGLQPDTSEWETTRLNQPSP
jgi:hypothetical protein